MGLWQLGRVRLVWQEPGPQQGLEITMRRRPVGEVTDRWLAELDPDDERPASQLTLRERAERAHRNAGELAKLIVEWNINGGNGEPARINVKSLLAHCDFETINAIWDRYTEETTRVAPPLPSSSAGGQPSAETELQLPMEPLSDSPQ